jgi:hypothetical protein
MYLYKSIGSIPAMYLPLTICPSAFYEAFLYISRAPVLSPSDDA